MCVNFDTQSKGMSTGTTVDASIKQLDKVWKSKMDLVVNPVTMQEADTAFDKLCKYKCSSDPAAAVHA